MAWELPDIFKWLLVFTVAFIVTVAIYRLLIRRFDLLRFLFGMKTSRPFYQNFQKMPALILLPLIWLGLSCYAGFNQKTVLGQDRLPMATKYSQELDIVLNADSVAAYSAGGVRAVVDEKASIGRAVELASGGNQRIEPDPEVYFDIHFPAPAGRYFVWIRGKSDTDSELTDSIWLQADNQIGTRKGSVHLGNWNSFQPTGVYAWGSDVHIPYIVLLKHSGNHTIRIQPRQTPHRIDQIWLSRSQDRIPDTNEFVKNPGPEE